MDCTCTPATFSHPFEMCDYCQASCAQSEQDSLFVDNCIELELLTAQDMREADEALLNACVGEVA